MRLRWDDIYAGKASARGARVTLSGYPVFPEPGQPSDTLVLVRDAPCCGAHASPQAALAVEIHLDAPIAWQAGPIRVEGIWQPLTGDAAGWRYRIRAARVTPVTDPWEAGALNRRRFLALGALSGLAACAGPAANRYADNDSGQAHSASGGADSNPTASRGAGTNRTTSGAAGTSRAESSGEVANGTASGGAGTNSTGSGSTGANRSAAGGAGDAAGPFDNTVTLAWMREQVTIDMHSHAGHVALGRARIPRAFTPVAAPMEAGGMDVICLAIVTDSSADHIVETASGRRRIVAYREPDPGEMSSRGELSFQRLHALMAAQGLRPIVDTATLKAARATGGGVIVAAEGADFLEGSLDRLGDAWRRHALRHLQLTHYRVNELGDIQTAPPVHGGLTDFGADVIRQCNRLGIVVDVAHGTHALVERAAAVTTRPLILSHTELRQRPSRYSRAISPSHARLIAQTGGVIGIWPVSTSFPTMDAMAGGIRAMADVVGVRHVGLGSDMLGLLSPSVLNSYRKLPQLAQALADAGFTREEAGMILGGNYARVWAATVG